ncbi:ATP-binding cassette domain-containing protein [Anthocerotibacter panamensis]|uniref:ATP-binding cassette domain-containing protein n=1 Tax=Anthocerotibacter panamensis TaxID=2857077 RepID=UPI001C404B50|nr:ATP-binding cassette domain-containing protein [Anthocerotibacter panamensis]
MIAIEGVTKTYGKRIVLASTTLSFPPQATTVLIGPSGCGKSTLLRLIVGLISPDTGRVLLEGQELTPANANTLRHKIGYVIQDGGLFPHLSAAANVTLLARYLKRPALALAQRLQELCDLVRLSPKDLNRYPKDLSGGQRQRVGIMRALMLDPPILLLDEPLGALDPITRSQLQTELKNIFTLLDKTVVLVTHDMGEAAYFGDEIILMRQGQIVQRGSLTDLLQRPAEPYVTDFIQAQRSPLATLEAGFTT